MRIIINRSDAIGDTLLTSPMATLIKRHIPDAKITFIISPKCQGLFEKHPDVDECWILDSKRSRLANFWRLLRRFKSAKGQAYFHVGGSALPTFVAWLLWVRIRGGLRSKISTFLFLNKGTRQKRSMVEMHESDYNLSLLWPLKITYNYKERSGLAPVINLDANEQAEKRDKETIFIHPGMVGHTLNWSSRNYARLAVRLDQKYPNRFLFVVSYTPSDMKYINDFKDELSLINIKVEDLIYFDGSKKGLRDYIVNLAGATLFIGPSTGTTHIANALRVSQIAIYSPIRVQSAMRWGPFDRDQNRIRVITPEVICGEATHCAKESCPYYKCMAKIEVDEVLEQAVALIDGNKDE